MPQGSRKTGGRVFVALFAFWIICCGFSIGDFSWHPLPNGINEHDIAAVAVGSDTGLLAATRNGVYQSFHDRKEFQRILTFPTGDQRAYSIYTEQNWIAVATQQGLWESSDLGKNWRRTFNPAQALHRRCYGVFKSGDIIFVGTAQGLFRKHASENTWYRHKSELKYQPIYEIIGDQDNVFIAAQNGVYRQSGDSELTKVFSVISAVSEEEDGEEDAYAARLIRAIAYYHKTLYIVTVSGIWEISNGQTERIPGNGLPFSEVEDLEVVTSLLSSHGQRAPEIPNDVSHEGPGPVLFLATRKGVFAFLNDQWVNTYQGLSTNMVNGLASDADGNLYAASDRGIFRCYVGPDASGRPDFNGAPRSRALQENVINGTSVIADYSEIQKHFSHEPSVQQVQEMVINYADVSKAKIDEWKQQARLKSFLPSVSLDLDRDAGDLYHWNTGANPDELQKGTEIVDWGIGLSWDLSDLVWSTDQTSIDSRSKLMVELRDDLLNQATRMYFERRRLQIELLGILANDPRYWTQQMRIDELTAGLDGMTGGRFSRCLTND